MTQLGAGGVVNTFNGRTGTVALLYTDLTAVNGALIQVQPSAPSGAPYPIDNQLWWNSSNTQLYIRYFDGTNHQWVQANSSSGPPPSTTVPLADATPGVVGTSSAYARADHQHTANLAWAGDVGRNVLHNSMMNIIQRGRSGFPVTAVTYTADRWMMQTAASDTQTVTIAALSDANRTTLGDEAILNCLQSVFTGTATGSSLFQQRIEGVKRLSGKRIIISFWAFASAALSIGVNMAQVFGTGGSPSATVQVAGQAVALSAGWNAVRYAVTVNMPSTSGLTLGTNGDDFSALNFWFSNGQSINAPAAIIGVQSGTVAITGVQLEIAQAGQTQPTPLEKLDPVMQLQQCQRFFSTSSAQLYWYASAAGYINGNSISIPPMRALPTITTNITGNTNGSSNTITPLSTSSILFYNSAVAAGTVQVNASYTASADL
jgi:hypothetical protein